MITFIMLLYAAGVVVAFKVIKIKVKPVTVAAAVTLGVLLIALIVVVWKQAAPLTPKMIVRRKVLQVIPDAREFVSKVHVKPDQMVKKGDLLFELRPDRFENAVEKAAADLEAARSTVSQLEASVTEATEAVRKSEAETAVAKLNYDTALAIQADVAGAVSKLRITETEQAYRAAQAADVVAKASLKQAQFALASARHGTEAAQAALGTAQFNLDGCRYVSPVDGQVVNWQIYEGLSTARWRFLGVGTVMDFSDTAILAVLPQNQLKNVKPGDTVEIAFERRPGEVVSGKVERVIKYTGEGQLAPSGEVPRAADIGSRGMLAARIRLDDAELARSIPLGAAGTTAIYTEFGKAFHVITKVTMRVKAWMNYLP